MGFLAIIAAAVIAAVILAFIITMNSNYLDQNINTSLNLTEKLKLKGTFSSEDRKANNNILRNKLSTIVKAGIIMDEIDRHNRAPTLINTQVKSDEKLLLPPSPPVTAPQ